MEYLEKLNAKLVEVKKEIDNFEKNISELKEKYPEISAYELATKSNVNEYIEKIVEIGKKQILLQSKKSEYEKLNNEKTILEIKNKLSVGDEMEIIIPGKLETEKFKIEKLWDIETDEEIPTINPGRANQKVKIILPIKVQENWILRRKK